jgi:hypothetical protein
MHIQILLFLKLPGTTYYLQKFTGITLSTIRTLFIFANPSCKQICTLPPKSSLNRSVIFYLCDNSYCSHSPESFFYLYLSVILLPLTEENLTWFYLPAFHTLLLALIITLAQCKRSYFHSLLVDFCLFYMKRSDFTYILYMIKDKYISQLYRSWLYNSDTRTIYGI